MPTVALVAGNEAEPDASPVEPAAPPSGPGPERGAGGSCGRRGSRQRRRDGRGPGAGAGAPRPRIAAPRRPPRHRRRSLVEGTFGLHEQMVAFACRQAELGLSASRAMLASRSLPEILSLQGAFVGRAVENALAHTLEVTRLSAGILRQGLRSDDPALSLRARLDRAAQVPGRRRAPGARSLPRAAAPAAGDAWPHSSAGALAAARARKPISSPRA